VTIIGRQGESFADRARSATENAQLYRVALASDGVSWIDLGILALMLRVAVVRLYEASEPAGLFTADQLEVGTGLWLLFKGLPSRPAPAVPSSAG
jgi:hypothetical protein